MPTTVTTPLNLDLMHAYLSSIGERALVAGTDWTLRMQVRENTSGGSTAAVSLTGATVVFTIFDRKSGVVLATRTSGTAITGASPAANEIDIDSTQTSENTSTYTGRGWVEIHFANCTSDIQKLTSAVGRRRWKLEVTLPDSGDGDAVAVGGGWIEVG